jgi:hypothetical protein
MLHDGKGSFDFAGLRFAYPASLRMTSCVMLGLVVLSLKFELSHYRLLGQ